MTNLASDISTPPAVTPLRVLIADDSRVVQRYLGLSLDLIPGAELAGRAFNTHDALAGVRELRPDVLLLDIEMPTGSGIDVLKQIPFDDARPLIFVLTLHASPSLSRHCRALGADRFFDKENELPLLLDVIAQLAAMPTPRRLANRPGGDGLFQTLPEEEQSESPEV
jgi:DNA-binding NarL/FixJ family response regulator